MIKILLRKQILELSAPFTTDKKTGKRKTVKQMIPYILLYVYLIGMIGFNSFNSCRVMIRLFAGTDLIWMYFALSMLLAMSLGVMLAIFTAFSSIFLAKDNDLLLSLPIRPADIVASRAITTFVWTFMFSFEGVIAAAVYYFIYCGFSLKVLVSTIFAIPMVSVLGGTVGLYVAWIVGVATKKLKKKNGVIYALLFIGIGAYSTLNSMLMSSMTTMASVEELSAKQIAITRVFSLFGDALAGDILKLAVSLAITAVLYCFALFLLNLSFTKVITTRVSGKKKAYKSEMIKTSSPSKALIRKEFRHFFGSGVYLMNTSMGSCFMILGTIALVIFGNKLKPIISSIPYVTQNIDIIGLGILLALSSMNDIASPSFSLEGKNLWILKTLPVESYEVLAAKINLHVIITMVPALLLTFTMTLMFDVSVMVFLVAFFYVFSVAGLELLMDLKWGCTTFTNEVVAVKQNVVVLASFGVNLLLATIAVGPFFLLKGKVGTANYLNYSMILLIIASLVVRNIVKSHGVAMFEKAN